MSYELPPLRFGYHELEPYFSEEMVRRHHLEHHRGESGATRTPFPAQGGQQSGDCGQQVMAA